MFVRNAFFSMACLAALSTPAVAKDIPTFKDVATRLNAQQEKNCKREEVRVSMQSNYQGVGVDDILKEYEQDKAQFASIAKKMDVEYYISGENYNFNLNDRYNRNNGPSLYNMNGGVNYVITSGKAKEFYQELGKAKIAANMNYSMNDNCNRQR